MLDMEEVLVYAAMLVDVSLHEQHQTASIAVRVKGSAYHFLKVMIYPAFLSIEIALHCVHKQHYFK